MESEAWFRTLLDTAPDAMVIVDETGKIEVVNNQAEQMFGYTRGELLGKEIEFLLPDRVHNRHQKHRKKYTDEPAVRPMGSGLDLVARRKNGDEFPVEISLSPVAMGANKFVSSVIRDISDRRRLEQEARTAQRAAERANKANSAFLAAASHDLRQPVQALSLLNGALRRTVKDEKALGMIESQEHSLTAMTNLLNSLLDISRLDAGAVSPEFEEFDVQRMFDRLSSEFGRQAQHKGLKFSATPCNAMVRSDPNLLSEIIQNLVSNAIRYTEAGTVSLCCIEKGDRCVVEVNDTGIGIQSDQLEAIFQEFHQVGDSAAKKEGFGLGLAIVRRLADVLDHDVAVTSQPGKGSSFTVTIPIVEAQRATTVTGDGEAVEESGSSSGLILLIEDDADVADAWRLLLELEGYDVATAASVAEIDKVIDELATHPTLIISDYHLLDGSTGVCAVNKVRDLASSLIPSFIVSGDTSKVVEDARQLENCTLMSKPVDTKRLLAAARSAVLSGEVPRD